MFQEILNRGNMVKIFFLYSKSENIITEFEKVLCEQEDVHSVYLTRVNNKKELMTAVGNARVQPFLGTNHLIVVNDVSEGIVNSLGELINLVSGNTFVLMTTRDYKVRRIIGKNHVKFNDIKKQSIKIVDYNYLTKTRLMMMYSYMVAKYGYTINDSIIKMLIKDYSRDIDGVYKLFKQASEGVVIKSEKQIVDMVGVGNRSIEELIQLFLTCSRGTVRKDKNSRKKILCMISALEEDIGINAVLSRLNSKLIDYIRLKLLIQMGNIKDNILKKEIPERYDEVRLQYAYKNIDDLKKVSMRALLILAKKVRVACECEDKNAGVLRLVYDVVK